MRFRFRKNLSPASFDQHLTWLDILRPTLCFLLYTWSPATPCSHTNSQRQRQGYSPVSLVQSAQITLISSRLQGQDGELIATPGDSIQGDTESADVRWSSIGLGTTPSRKRALDPSGQPQERVARLPHVEGACIEGGGGVRSRLGALLRHTDGRVLQT